MFMKSLTRQKAEHLKSNLVDLNSKWRNINSLAEKRQNQVQKAWNQTRQLQDEIKGMFKWMNEVDVFLKEQEAAFADPETMEAQLDQSEVSNSDSVHVPSG